MSTSFLRRAAPTLRSASSSSARAPVGRRFAAHAVEVNPAAPWAPKADLSWALPSAAIFVPLIAYYTNELYHSTLFAGADHGHDSHGHVDASHAEVAHTDNTFTKGTPKNAQKALVAEHAPGDNSEQAEAAEPRSGKGPEEKTVLSDSSSSPSDPVAEKSPEQAEGKPAPKSVQETSAAADKAEDAAPAAAVEKEVAPAAVEEKEEDDEKKAAAPAADEPEEKEVEASTVQALQSDGDPLAAKAHEEESSS